MESSQDLLGLPKRGGALPSLQPWRSQSLGHPRLGLTKFTRRLLRWSLRAGKLANTAETGLERRGRRDPALCPASQLAECPQLPRRKREEPPPAARKNREREQVVAAVLQPEPSPFPSAEPGFLSLFHRCPLRHRLKTALGAMGWRLEKAAFLPPPQIIGFADPQKGLFAPVRQTGPALRVCQEGGPQAWALELEQEGSRPPAPSGSVTPKVWLESGAKGCSRQLPLPGPRDLKTSWGWGDLLYRILEPNRGPWFPGPRTFLHRTW